MEFKNKRQFGLSLVGLWALTVIIFYFVDRRKNLNWNFKGVVEKVWYDKTAFPHVTVNGTEYDLRIAIWDFNIKINKGDTIIKKKGDERILLIRPKTRDTIYPNDSYR